MDEDRPESNLRGARPRYGNRGTPCVHCGPASRRTRRHEGGGGRTGDAIEVLVPDPPVEYAAGGTGHAAQFEHVGDAVTTCDGSAIDPWGEIVDQRYPGVGSVRRPPGVEPRQRCNGIVLGKLIDPIQNVAVRSESDPVPAEVLRVDPQADERRTDGTLQGHGSRCRRVRRRSRGRHRCVDDDQQHCLADQERRGDPECQPPGTAQAPLLANRLSFDHGQCAECAKAQQLSTPRERGSSSFGRSRRSPEGDPFRRARSVRAGLRLRRRRREPTALPVVAPLTAGPRRDRCLRALPDKRPAE